MKIIKTKIPEVLIIEPKPFIDERGFFMETWNKKKFADLGLTMEFVQDNHSKSVKNTLRGLHYQIENAQGKLVRVIQGEVFDIAVDLRKSSPHFGKWVGATLTAENKKMLWVPTGFAHGFLVLTETAEFQYKCSDFYNPKAERCIIWNDPQLDIAWPITESENLILSEKDKKGVLFKNAEVFE